MSLWRSLVFWGGLVVMGFVGWAWRDSIGAERGLRKTPFSLESTGGGVCLQRCDRSWLEPRPVYFSRKRPEQVHWGWWPRPGYVRFDSAEQVARAMRSAKGEGHGMNIILFNILDLGHSGDLGDWFVFVPYWLLMLVAMVLWAAALVWRWMRIKRARMVAMVEGGEG